MTEEQSNGYQDLYQAGWNAAIDAKATPSADVPLLTDEEIVTAIEFAKKIPAAYIGWMRDQRIEYGRSIEQAVRQKAGLK